MILVEVAIFFAIKIFLPRFGEQTNNEVQGNINDP